MTDGWRDRLRAAVEQSPKSASAASLAAGHGRGYISSLLNEGKTPSIEAMADITRELGVGAAYLAFGYDVDAKTEEIIRLLAENPHLSDGIVQILRSKSAA